MSTSFPPTAWRLEQPWALQADELVGLLDVDPGNGLSEAEADRRRLEVGPNQLVEAKPMSAAAILAAQFKSLIVALLAVAAVVSLILGDQVESLAVTVVIAINTVVGFVTEYRAIRSMEALRELGGVATTVLREGVVRNVPAEALVPGDVVIIDAGDVVTADCRLISGSRVEVDESALTGESVPVPKRTSPDPADTLLADRYSMLHKGTAVTGGSGEAVVVATGMATELGRISRLVAEADQPETPLQIQLTGLGHRLLWLTLVVVVVIAVVSVAGGRPLRLAIETAVALAVAAIPEGLPIVATVALARGMRRMAEKSVLVERLAAVETLGSVSAILTDKTGTLTENEMVVERVVLADRTVEVGGGNDREGTFTVAGSSVRVEDVGGLRTALEIGALCNNATLEPDGAEPVGDPTEVALLIGAAKAGIWRYQLLDRLPEVGQEAFDPRTRMMATVHQREDGWLIAVKGAPGAVLEASSSVHGAGPIDAGARDNWLEMNDAMAADGLRVLGLAYKEASSPDAEPYSGLTFVGLVGLVDPPRDEVKEALAECRRAGVEVVMVTGDQPATAAYIASALGIANDQPPVSGRELLEGPSADRLRRAVVFARTSPEQKLDLIEARQRAGQRVAMIGDGVNDAPALKRADIGVAMGIRGTEVAKEAADIVLRDDRFGSVVDAIREGRVIFDNIRKFVVYLLSSNLSEIVVVGIVSVMSLPLPLLPLQILYLNLITDVFPALALGTGTGEPDVMRRRPRPADEGVLTRTHWLSVGLYGLMLALPVLGVLTYAHGPMDADEQTAVTMSFMTLAFAQLWHVFNMTGGAGRPVPGDVVRNPWVWAALVGSASLLLVAIYVPVLADVLDVVPLDAGEWLVVMAASLSPLVAGLAFRALRSRSR